MARLTVQVFDKIKSLRRKYEKNGNKRGSTALDQLMWFSIPCVYTNFRFDFHSILKDMSKISQRRRRIRNYIRGMMCTFDNLYLVSLTFSEENYQGNSRESRTKYVQRWLNSYSVDYYACLDIGKENGREHYHAICAFDCDFEVVKISRGKTYFGFVDEARRWSLGFYSVCPLNKSETDLYRSLNYAMKASTYSFKSMDNSIKPFHKRGVEHWDFLEKDIDL